MSFEHRRPRCENILTTEDTEITEVNFLLKALLCVLRALCGKKNLIKSPRKGLLQSTDH